MLTTYLSLSVSTLRDASYSSSWSSIFSGTVLISICVAARLEILTYDFGNDSEDLATPKLFIPGWNTFKLS